MARIISRFKSDLYIRLGLRVSSHFLQVEGGLQEKMS